MLRLWVPGVRAGDATVRIAGAELRHLRTLRLAPGSTLRVLDDAGGEHEVVLERLDAREAVARVVSSHRPDRESPLQLVLAPALLKGAKMDVVVEKATELGVHRIAPVTTARIVAQGGHVERWRRIAVAAAKQSGRTRVPEVEAPVPLAALAAVPWPGLRLVPWEGERSRRLDALPDRAAAVVVVIGPEGGLDDGEITLLRAHDFQPITLGPRVLRAETASLTVAAHCQRRWGDG
jgi:16S rRNA (uracil1498-N3)-methyltransferase